MATRKYTAEGTLTTVTLTGLDSLGNGSVATASAATSNDAATTERDPFAVVEVNWAAQGTARNTGATLVIYAIPEADGTNFGDTTGVTINNYRVATITLDDATAARRVILWDIPMPPTDFKWALKNNTGQTSGSSGNTFKFARYSDESV